MGGQFNITPDDLRDSGSTMRNFGDQITSGGSKLSGLSNRLMSGARKDSSGVGSVIVSALGKCGGIAGKVFSEGGRVAGAAGDRLHGNASAHEQNDTDLAGSFRGIKDAGPSAESAPDPKAGSKPDTAPDGPIKSANHDPAGNSAPTGSRPSCGDPIDLSTGRMMLTQVDVELAAVLPLVLARTHLSGYTLGRSFGPSWACTADQRLEVGPDGVQFAAEDGTLLSYPSPAVEVPVLPGLGPRWPLHLGEDGSYGIAKPELGQLLHFPPRAGSEVPLGGIAGAGGQDIRFDRDDAGVLTGIRHSAGYRIAVTSVSGRITVLALAGGEPIELGRFGYDEPGHLTEVINSSGEPLRFDHDDAGRIVRWQDRNGRWYRYEFDGEGRCVHAEGADGYLTYRFGYDRTARRTTATDSLGGTSVHEFDERRQEIRRTDQLGAVTEYQRDELGRLRAETDPLGRTTRYEHDTDGNLTSITGPDGATTLAGYDEQGRRIRVTEPGGAVWQREYTATGAVAADVDPLGGRTTYGYDAAGHLASSTDPLGAVTRYTGNAAGLPVAVTDPLGATTRYDYDRLGRVRAGTDPLGGVTRRTWTVEGRLLTLVGADGAARRWSYDGEGNARTATDPRGALTRTEFGHFDLPVTEIAADGSQLRTEYDTELRPVTVTNQLGQVWRYSYDAAGRCVGEVDFDGRERRYRYDAAGQLVERVNAAGESVLTSWDAGGRPAGRTVGGETTTFRHDPAGRLVAARTGDSELTIEYDSLGRVIAESVDGRTVWSGYDQAGRRTTRLTAAGVASAWAYYDSAQPLALHSGEHTIRFRYDAAGREVERVLGESALLTQTWDAAHRLRGQTLVSGPAPIALRDYAYRPDGCVTAVSAEGAGARDYELDELGRVTAIRGPDRAERYGYDAAGNVTSAGPADWAYDGSLLTRAGDVRYQHDAEGRVVARHRDGAGTWRYTWDALDRLVGVRTPDGQRWRYRYDPLGRRTSKERLTAEGGVAERVEFSWDGDRLADEVHDGVRAVTWDWEPAGHRPVSRTASVRTGGEWVRSDFHAVVTDLVGSPAELLDPYGGLVWRGETTLWGVRSDVDGDVEVPLRFPGQYHDAETGLHYNRHRYYDPATARYLTRDPLGLTPGPNPFTYVPNPLTWSDPLGLMGCGLSRPQRNPEPDSHELHSRPPRPAPALSHSELHGNPTGPSLVLHRPGTPHQPDINRMTGQGAYDRVVQHGFGGAPQDRLVFHEDPKTMLENRPKLAGQHVAFPVEHTGHTAITGVTGKQILENLARNGRESRDYWAAQDRRDQQVAGHAGRQHTEYHGRDHGPDHVQTDGLLHGANSKITGAEALLRQHDGLVIGSADHRSDPPFPFLAANMKQLHEGAGVNTIYSEDFRDDAHKGLLDDYFKDKNSPESQALSNYLDKKYGDLNNDSVRQMLQAARANDVRVHGIDGFPARKPEVSAEMPAGAADHVRAGMMNTYATQVIQDDRAGGAGGAEGKYIAVVGAGHAHVHAGPPGGVQAYGSNIPPNFPGVGDILGVPSVQADPGDSNRFQRIQ